MTEVELYRQPNGEVAITRQIDDWVPVLHSVVELAEQIARSPFVPDGLRGNVPATAAAILTARELGVPPMTGLANIYIVHGRPGLSALLMRALIQSKGHQWEDVDVSDVRVVVRGRRQGETDWTEASFTAAQAAKAKINLSTYPQDMLYARASVRLARRKFADVIAGMPYIKEELEDGDFGERDAISDEPAAIEPPAKPRTAQRRTAARAPAGDPPGAPSANGSEGAAQDREPPASETTARTARRSTRSTGPEDGQPPLPGEDDAAEPDAPATESAAAPASGDRHRKLVGTVHAQFKRLGFEDDEKLARLAACEAITGAKRLTSSNDLGIEQLSAVADTLARCKDRGALIALLAETEKAAQDSAERAFQAGDGHE